MPICGSCGKDIRVCDLCGGLICSDDCKDREEDGCMCEEEELMEGENDDEEEEW